MLHTNLQGWNIENNAQPLWCVKIISFNIAIFTYYGFDSNTTNDDSSYFLNDFIPVVWFSWKILLHSGNSEDVPKYFCKKLRNYNKGILNQTNNFYEPWN